jgi:predicted DCC family thiol-disulfide oxidoreductase YuxK
MRGLTVLFDETCGFCQRCAEWISRQPAFVPVRCMPAGSAEVARRFPDLPRGTVKELVAVDSDGGVYQEADAFLIILWALQEYRGWGRRLASPALKPWARAVFWRLSKGRHTLSRWLGWEPVEKVVKDARSRQQPTCADGRCEVDHLPARRTAPTPPAAPPRSCPSCKSQSSGRSFCPACLASLLTEKPDPIVDAFPVAWNCRTCASVNAPSRSTCWSCGRVAVR